MLEATFTYDKDAIKLKEYIIGSIGLLAKTMPVFISNFSHIIMLFTDIFIMKKLKNESMIGGYGLGLTIVHTFLYAIICAFNYGLYTLLS